MKIRKIRSGFCAEEYVLLARQFVLSDKIKPECSENVIHWKRLYNPLESRLWFGTESLPDDVKNKDFYEHLVFVNINGILACYYLLSIDFKMIGLRKVNSKKTDKLIGGYADLFEGHPEYIGLIFKQIMDNLGGSEDIYAKIIGNFRISPFSPYENPGNFKSDLGTDFDDLKTMPDGNEVDGLSEYVEFINWAAVDKTTY